MLYNANADEHGPIDRSRLVADDDFRGIGG
jgi:hypothetical protein